MRPAAGYHFGAEEEALLLEHSSKASSSKCLQYYPELAHYTPAQLKQRIPAAHDSRKVYAQCDAKFALNQKSCGSCWAFSAATTFNWRLCVMSNGTYKNELISPQTLTSCTCQASFVRHACARVARDRVLSAPCAGCRHIPRVVWRQDQQGRLQVCDACVP